MPRPRELADYAYLRQASPSALAWEFLRRNRCYRRDWRCCRTLGPPKLRLSSGAILYRARRRFPLAEAWGLAQFVDPALTAGEASLFWLPTLYQRQVRALGLAGAPGDSLPFDFAQWDHRCSVRIGLDGSFALACQTGQQDFGLLIAGLDRPAGCFDLIFQLKAFDHCQVKTAVIAAVERLAAGPAARARPVRAPGHVYLEMLVALDGRASGLSYRQIAAFLFGEARVEADWNGPSRSLKDRTRRLVQRGAALAEGGYRALLC
jgi:hypothetical protein